MRETMGPSLRLIRAVPDASRSNPTGRETVIVALGQGSIMLFGGVLALLIAQLFGKNTETDAFFAAYGVYAIGITFTQSFRLTAVPRLVAGGDEMITRLLGAVLIMTLALGIPMVALATPLGALLVERDPTVVAPDALRILWVALLGQLVAALLATVLVVRGSYVAVGVATLLVGLVSVGTFFVTEQALGILAAAVGLAAGGLWLVALLGGLLLRAGWRPKLPRARAVHAMWDEARQLTSASAIFFGTSLTYVVCVALAAHQGAGEATLFAYAYVLATTLLGVTANVSAMVRSPSLVASDDRTAEVAEAGISTFRFTVILAGPVIAMVLLVGKPLVGIVLGADFEGASASSLLVTVACLLGWILATAGGLFAIVELLARGARGRLAALAVGQVVVLAGAAAVGAELAGIEGIAAALSLVTLGATVLLLRWAFGRRWKSLVAAMTRVAGRELVVLAFAFGPSGVLLALIGGPMVVTLTAGFLAAVLVIAMSHVAWPLESRALIGVLPARSRTA